MKDQLCVEFLQWALPQLGMRWPGFRKVRKQVCKRIDRRLRELELADVQAYREHLHQHPAEWSILDRLCRIPISRFYRDRDVFDHLRQSVLPGLADAVLAKGPGVLNVWSAGCASGEEPWTLSISWKLDLAMRYPDVLLRVLASDVDPHMLERARNGCYSSSSLKDLPQAWQAEAFVRDDGEYCLRPEFRDGVEFELRDIRQSMPDGPFHLILCRHLVFTYFDEATRQGLLLQLVRRLEKGGVLVTGKKESLPPDTGDLLPRGPLSGIYRRAVRGRQERACRDER
jgi:chemotaxis protein methyltransferase CheR